MAETRKRGSKSRGSAVLGLLSQEGQAGRLVTAPDPKPPSGLDETSGSPHEDDGAATAQEPSEPENRGAVVASSSTVKSSQQLTVESEQARPSKQRRVAEIAAEPGEYPSEEERDRMTPAQVAALPPPPSTRRNYKSQSQTVRCFPHSAEALRRAWIDARMAGDPLLSYTEFASRVVAAGLKALEDED